MLIPLFNDDRAEQRRRLTRRVETWVTVPAHEKNPGVVGVLGVRALDDHPHECDPRGRRVQLRRARSGHGFITAGPVR
jgi:hypothetical protein